MHQPTDPALLRAAFGEGDQDAWREIVRQYSPLVRQFAFSIGWREQHLDDLVQEVMIVLLEKRGSFEYDPRGRFRNYLFQVVKNVAHSQRRKLRRISREHLPRAQEDGFPEIDDPLIEEWERQHRLFHLETAKAWLKEQVSAQHWLVFEQLMLAQSPQQVAEQSGEQIDNVYQIKKRVIDRLEERVREQITAEGGGA